MLIVEGSSPGPPVRQQGESKTEKEVRDVTLMRWNPYREMVSLRDALDRLFERNLVQPFRDWPERMESGPAVSVDVYESNGNLVVNAELPGLKPHDVDISLSDNRLTIRAEFQTEDEGERGNVYHQERRYGKFERSFTLPTGIDTDAIDAEFEDGVLTVTLPKPEEARPKRIPIAARS
jgi:HSP20 family protein